MSDEELEDMGEEEEEDDEEAAKEQEEEEKVEDEEAAKKEEEVEDEELEAGEPGVGQEAAEVEEQRALTLEEAKDGLANLGRAASGLQHAYLLAKVSDLRLTDVSALQVFRHLLFVDVSGNLLRDDAFQVLAKMAQLLSIQAAGNRLTSPYLPPMGLLQVLAVSDNPLTSAAGVEHPLLECLELSRCGLQELSGLEADSLPRLRTLELRGNSLASVSGLRLEALEGLYLAANSIARLEGLEALPSLQVLHLRDNPLTSLDGLPASLAALRYLNVRGCRLAAARETRKLAALPALQVLVVAGNPFAGGEEEEEEEDYRLEVLAFLPRLRRLDKVAVDEEELEQARELRAELEEADQEEADQEAESQADDVGDGDDDGDESP
ncbi:leucine-rich repeat-containing protein 23-like isoform X1 [Bacillus rossius redtenbacheri]|uniref:leucine-rich repeat-containing protein 23-like isoform X1 n=1 Tax=Bacillus rossius redtenbacheri TaxID=93214 RepID=UPI002FDD3AA7